jgi:ribosomal protein S30
MVYIKRDTLTPHCLYHDRNPNEVCYCFPLSVTSRQAFENLRKRFIERTIPRFIPTKPFRKPLSEIEKWKFEGGVKDSTYIFAGRRLTPQKAKLDSIYNQYTVVRRILPVIPNSERLHEAPRLEDFPSYKHRVIIHKQRYIKSNLFR